jgi:hypothetical protein
MRESGRMDFKSPVNIRLDNAKTLDELKKEFEKYYRLLRIDVYNSTVSLESDITDLDGRVETLEGA